MLERPLNKSELELLVFDVTRVEVTPENLPALRQEVAEIREMKGLEAESLEAIRYVKEGAKRIEAHEDVVDLFWEEHLIGRHMVMTARDKERLWNLPLKVVGIAEGYVLMRNSALEAERYIESHNVDSKRARSGRFLGGVAMMERRFKKAASYFDRSASLFEGKENWKDRVNRLELLGFLAEALIISGKTPEGLEITRQTFREYDSGDGARLRHEDYYTWAVWKSGCVIKAWHAIFAKRVILDKDTKDEFLALLSEGSKVLEPPTGVKIWGNFDLRKNEIAAIRRQLAA